MSVLRLAVIVNPFSGKQCGRKVLEQVRPVFAAAGVELDIRLTERSDHAGVIAQTLDLARLDGICIVGGDGTIHEVVNGLMTRGEPISVPLGIIPAGTGNSLAQHLGCADPIAAARRIVAGGTRPLDVVRAIVGERVIFCVDILGWGAVAQINRTAERLRFFGRARYTIAALWHILHDTSRPAQLDLDGQAVDDNFLFVIACNPQFTGAGMKLAPRAEIDDGKIDVVLVRRATRWQMLKLLSKLSDGSHVSLEYVEYFQVRSFAIATQTPEPLNLDGEMSGHTPLSAVVIPAALSVFR